ncbi:YheC/YheD family protein [Guptibacillus hwajinpoensis]|uniref:YheC/YheD family endospore coat-associated protein n=1 Tax=Guptibacillus hwajinpoensis TaxID=208199 RepID=UPI001CFC777C|nr:YheC/YheD family protein [Pseudalkalibacillus hwajinpoensis]
MIVSTSSIPGLAVHFNKSVRLQFGIKSIEVIVHHSDSVESETIYLSSHVIQQLGLPLTCAYDVIVQKDKITIGPFIGILCEITNRKLAEMLPTYKSFVKGYQYIGGAILVFSMEGIQKEKRLIKGFLYHPKKNVWEPVIMPFPAVMMSIAEPSLTSASEAFHDYMTEFDSLLGGRVFNYPHFSKWEMHHMLLSEWKAHLPETAIYQDVSDIYEMLSRHGSIYIKPLYGRLGKQIYNVVEHGTEIMVKYDEKRAVFTNSTELDVFFQKSLSPNAYLIQETIPLKTYEQSVIDFRVMAAKNQHGEWEVLGIYSRYGASGQIVSNISAGGHTEIARNTLKEVWKLEDDEIQRVEKEMEQLVLQSIQTLEDQGYHLGNIGVDLGLDEACHISIIEINHQNPDPYIALMAKDRLAFYKCRFDNMMYARYLGEF